MTDSNQVINLQTKGDGEIKKATNSLKQLKQELKEAQAAALNGDGNAARRVAELRDRLEDLRDETRSLQGSGVERIGASFGLLGQGLADFDWDKIKLGFQGIGAAMKAIPIFLVVEGVKYLIDNWDKLTKGNGIVAKSLRAIGDLFDWIGNKITEFTDLIGLTNSKLEEQGNAIKKNAEKSKEALEAQTKAYDRQIEQAKAAGKTTIALEKAKQEAIIQTNLTIAKQIQAFVAAGGALDEEKRKQLGAALEAIRDARSKEIVIEEEHSKKLKEEQKKRLEEYRKHIKEKNEIDEKRKKSLSDAADDEEKNLKSETERLNNELNKRKEKQEKDEAEKKEKEEKNRAEDLKTYENNTLARANLRVIEERGNIASLLNQLQTRRDIELSNANLTEEQKKEIRAKYAEEERKIKLKGISDDLQLASQANASLQALSDTIFSIKLANTKKGSEEEERALRKQFQINKALQISNAAINGAQATVKAIAEFGPPPSPFGIAGIIAAGVTTAAAIAKIASTQFQPTGGGASSGASASLPSGIGGGLPQVNSSPPIITPQGSTLLNGNFGQNNQPIKTYVVESEMTNAQRRIKRLGDQATF